MLEVIGSTPISSTKVSVFRPKLLHFMASPLSLRSNTGQLARTCIFRLRQLPFGMRYSILLVLVLCAFQGFSQKQKIVDYLNRELKREIRQQFKSPRFDGDTLELLQPFRLETGDTLSVTILLRKGDGSGTEETTQKMRIQDVLSVDKDINVLFRTAERKVLIRSRRILDEGEIREDHYQADMFFLFRYTPNNNESMAATIRKYFAGAGITIQTEFWAD